jgi:hypothetical protein
MDVWRFGRPQQAALAPEFGAPAVPGAVLRIEVGGDVLDA